MKVVFVYGPTCSGKTDLGIRLSESFGGDVISCDSVQVYKRVEIGTAKPNSEERARAKHHLVDFVDFPGKYTAADFREDALKILKTREEAGDQLCYVVGGTGFYFQALEKGMSEAPKVTEELAEEIRLQAQNDLSILWKELEEKDPEYSKKISANDSYRICRAIEVVRSGILPSEAFGERPSDFPYPLLKLYLKPNRGDLLKRMEKRTAKMLEAGLVDEVKRLRSEGLSDWAPMSSVGYKEVGECLDGEISDEELAYWVTTRSMQLAKRQKTWFSRDKDALVFDHPVEDWEKIEQEVKVFLGS